MTKPIHAVRRWSARPHGWWIALYTCRRSYGWKIVREPNALFIDAGWVSLTVMRQADPQRTRQVIDRALAIFDRAAGIVALALLVFMVLAIVYYGAFK